MIITPDDPVQLEASMKSLDPDAKVALEMDPDEPPPTYSPPTESRVNRSESDTGIHAVSPLPPTFKTKPTNFLALSNDHDSIRGEFVIDPSIEIPSSMLPPLGDDETEDSRRHLCLKSKSSSVHADIWLLGPGLDKSRRTTIALTSGHGSIDAQLHTVDNAAPFSLTANAPHGTIRLAIPHSFQGLITLSTRHGSVSLSDPLIQNATQLSQLGDKRRYFIGDFQRLGEEEWQGDQVELDSTHGSIRMRYVDEGAVRGEQRKKGLLDRLFGK